MQTIISNKIYVYNATTALLWWCEDNLVLTNPMWQQLKRIGKDDTITRKHIPSTIKLYVESNNDLILPFGLLSAIWKYIKDYPYEIRFNENGCVIDQKMPMQYITLFDYQEEAVKKMISAKGGVLESAAGSGKTTIGIEIIKRLGKNALWLCHTSDLLNQTVKRIHFLYPSLPVGTITEGEVKMVNNGITVSTIQTLVNVDKDIYKDKFDVIITDECHKVNNSPTIRRMFGKVIESIPARYKYGLTATPERSDTMIKSMYATIGCNTSGEFLPTFVIERSKTNTLTAKHIKVDLDTEFSYDCLNSDGTFNYMALIDYLSNNEKRNEQIVENVIKTLDKHKKQLVLCSRVEHCEVLNDMLQKRGVNSVLLVGKVSKKRRIEILNDTIDFNVIVGTISLIKEGLDIPQLSCLHWAMIISDKVATIQSAGRIERVYNGKPMPEIYDYVDIHYPYCIGKYKKRVNWLKRR